MTALDQFERLEASGIYHPSPADQRRDVILSLGDASLTISDLRGAVHDHWSLAAIERINPGRRPAIYAPAPEAPERVEVSDETMIRAIEKIRAAVLRGRPRPGRVRGRLVWAVSLGVAAIALFWLPGALMTYTASVVPDAARAAIGDDLEARIAVVSGRPCGDPRGLAALRALLDRLGPAGPAAADVLPGGVRAAAHLPGGRVILARGIAEDHESPAVAAGYLLAEAARMAETDPMLPLLRHAGIAATLRLMTSGRLPEEALSDYAEAILLAPPAPVSTRALVSRFRAAGVPSTPYAYALDVTGVATLDLIEADPVPASASPVLSDDQWVALQGICGG